MQGGTGQLLLKAELVLVLPPLGVEILRPLQIVKLEGVALHQVAGRIDARLPPVGAGTVSVSRHASRPRE